LLPATNQPSVLTNSDNQIETEEPPGK